MPLHRPPAFLAPLAFGHSFQHISEFCCREFTIAFGIKLFEDLSRPASLWADVAKLIADEAKDQRFFSAAIRFAQLFFWS